MLCYAKVFQNQGHEAFLIKSDISSAKVPKVTALKERFLRILSNPLAFLYGNLKRNILFN